MGFHLTTESAEVTFHYHVGYGNLVYWWSMNKTLHLSVQMKFKLLFFLGREAYHITKEELNFKLIQLLLSK